MNIGMAYLEFGRGKGIARAAFELSSRMAAAGHEVHYHCVHVDREARDSRIRYHQVRGWNAFHTPALAAFALAGRASLRGGGHDVTHSHGNIIGSDVITAHSCHKAGLRIFRPPNNLGIADTLRLFIERKNFSGKRFKRIIAVSEGVKRELEHEYNVHSSDIIVIPNGVDLKRFSPSNRLTRRKGILQRAGWNDSDVVALFVAHEFERKGLKVLLQAMGMVDDLRLLVLGGDDPSPYTEMLRRLKLEERVVFLGAVSNIENIYAAADMFVFPTQYEAFSLATLEAAASGLPIIATNVNGTEELIVHGKNGLFISRDPDDIAGALHRLCADPALRQQMGASARLTATGYDWDDVTSRTLKVYREVM